MRRTLRSDRPVLAGAIPLIAGVAPATPAPAAARFFRNRELVTAPLLALMATGTIAAAAGAQGGAESPNVSASEDDADRLPADAGRVHRYVTTPLPGELRWQQIPWRLDLEEGVRRARAENRPLVLFVSGDEPLGRC